MGRVLPFQSYVKFSMTIKKLGSVKGGFLRIFCKKNILFFARGAYLLPKFAGSVSLNPVTVVQ